MKGSLQKHIDSCILPCKKCIYFRDDDPDVFYCEQERYEFPGLCELYNDHSETINSNVNQS